MGTNQNVIEINGKKYNAVTGKLILAGGSATKAVDGFTRKASHAKKTHTTRATASHAKKTAQKSHTLMRSAVKKPAIKHRAKQTHVADITKPTLKTSHQRQRVASTTRQNTLVSRFGDTQPRNSVVKKVQHLPVKKQKLNSKIQTTHSAPAISDAPAKEQLNFGASQMIERALANATSHENPTHHKKKRSRVSRKLGVSSRAVAVSSTVLAGVLLGGFFAVQNVPNLSMRVASARAGFSATLPSYNPSGFSFSGPINYTPGQVTITYDSNTDDRNYDLTQRTSNWNSDALLSNFVIASNQPYQTYLDRGRTLYIYDGSSATWVDNGIWYQIEGESRMTTDQLVRIAASM